MKKRFVPKFVIVYGNRWEALYVDNDLVCQKRHITENDILHAINMMYVEVDNRWLNKRGRWPGKYNEIPLKKLK